MYKISGQVGLEEIRNAREVGDQRGFITNLRQITRWKYSK